MNFSQSTVFNIVASIGLMLVNTIIGIITARVLGPEQVGRYNIFLTTQTMFVTIFALGIGQSCIYFINSFKIDKKVILSTSVNAMLPFSVIASSMFLFFLFSFNNYFGEIKLTYLLLFVIGANALLLTTIFVPVLLADMQVVKNQIVKYSARVITLIIILHIILFKIKLDVGILISLTGIANIISLSVLYFYFKNFVLFENKIDKILLKKLLRWGIKLSGSNIASIILTSLPVYFLSSFSISDKLANVGYYSRATSLLVLGTIIASSIGPLIYAKWSSLKEIALKDHVKKISMPLFVINLLISLTLIVFSSFFIRLLYGTKYYPAIPVLKILAFTLVFNGLKEICYGILSSQGAPLKIMKNLFISIILLTIILMILIPKYGLIGCSWGTLIVTAISAFLLMNDTTKISLVQFVDYFIIPKKYEIIELVINLRHRKYEYKKNA